MRRDTQIGVILGMVILVIIGVFLSTRSSFKEADMPVLVLPEESVSEVEEIDIFDLAQEPKSESPEQENSVEEQVVSEGITVNGPAEEPLKYGSLLEGKWKGILPEQEDKELELSQIQETEKEELEKRSAESKSEDTRQNATEERRDVSEVASGTVEPELFHTVRSNENLAALSKEYYGDETKWRTIFEANRDKLSNPNVLYVGLKLRIPNLNDFPEESRVNRREREFAQRSREETSERRTYTIRRGDTLHSIASEFYQDGSLWWKIYEANDDVIVDKNVLIIGDSLVIPY